MSNQYDDLPQRGDWAGRRKQRRQGRPSPVRYWPSDRKAPGKIRRPITADQILAEIEKLSPEQRERVRQKIEARIKQK